MRSWYVVVRVFGPIGADGELFVSERVRNQQKEPLGAKRAPDADTASGARMGVASVRRLENEIFRGEREVGPVETDVAIGKTIAVEINMYGGTLAPCHLPNLACGA